MSVEIASLQEKIKKLLKNQSCQRFFDLFEQRYEFEKKKNATLTTPNALGVTNATIRKALKAACWKVL